MSIANRPSATLEYLSRSVAYLRKENGLTQDALGALSLCDAMTISRLERKVNEPYFTTLEKISAVLETSVEDLIIKGKELSMLEQPSLREILCKNIRAARMQRKMTQKELASKAGVTIAYISGLERLKISISVDKIEGIARALGVNPGELFYPEFHTE